MKTPNNFEQIKQIVLDRAKENEACKPEYKKALKITDLSELCQVLKENFNWGCTYNVITPEFIEQFKEDFAANEIFVNTNIVKGFLLVSDNATVEASGNATVRAWDNATVEASGNATVRAWGNATVRASGNATVEASGNATVEAWGNVTVRAWGNAYTRCHSTIQCKICGQAIIRRWDINTIQFSDDNIKFEKVDAFVEDTNQPEN